MADNTEMRTASEDIIEMKRFPYYVIPDIEALATERDPEMLRIHRRRIAACVGDPDALRSLIGDASLDFQDFYGTSRLPDLSTSDTIDFFLEKFGTAASASQEEAVAALEESVPVMPPVADYASILEQQAPVVGFEDTPADATLGAIDAFLNVQPVPRMRPKKDQKEVEKPSLTESFAKILIKNGNYSRALEIITEISLNNPEKSIYFADQIRFLKKVISLESLKSC